jgi:rare lipoprotein A (peptidoglycan hydrolase)
MSTNYDPHVWRGLLRAYAGLTTAILLACLQVAPPSRPRVQSSREIPPPPVATELLMPAAVGSNAFEEPYTPPLSPSVPEPEPVMVEVELEIASVRNEMLFETGIASTYGVGDGFQGNRTACGQIFDTNVVQVAHKTLKCGTTIRVEDAATGKSVVAEVTDRGPYIRGRVVDLSWAAFSELDASVGLWHVNVYVVQ